MKKTHRTLILWTCLVMGLFPSLSFAVQNQAEPGAKALFYDPLSGSVITPAEKKTVMLSNAVRTKRRQPSQRRPSQRRQSQRRQSQRQPAQVMASGIHYWIELDGVGPVTADRIFRTGDAIRLHIRSNVNGYMSLWSLDAFGYGKPLFPAPNQPQPDNQIKAGLPYVTPNKIRFVPPVEDETLLVFFSTSLQILPMLKGNQGDNEIIAQAENSVGSKALVSETETEKLTQIGSYVINKNGGLVVQKIRLRHR